MTNRTESGIIDTESIKSAAREWGWLYALIFSLFSTTFTSIVLWFGITAPPADEFYPAFTAILRDIGIAGLASVVLTTTILEGWQTFMIISATFLKPRERRIREEALAKGRAEGRAEGVEEGRSEGIKEGIEKGIEKGIELGRAAVEEKLELERTAWLAWHERSELARAKGEEPPPPPSFGASNGNSG